MLIREVKGVNPHRFQKIWKRKIFGKIVLSVGAGLFKSCESPRFALGLSLFALHMTSFVLAGSVTCLLVVFRMSVCPEKVF